MKKKILSISLLCLLFTGCGYEPKETNKNVGKITESNEVQNQKVNTATPEPEKEEIKPAHVGEYVEGEVWKISLLEARQYDSIDGEYYSETPEIDGNKFVVLFFEVENISANDEHFNMFYIESYVDGYSADTEFLMNNPENYKNLSGDVASGKKLKGYVAYEVSPDWKEIEFSYKNWAGNSGKIATFLVTQNDITK